MIRLMKISSYYREYLDHFWARNRAGDYQEAFQLLRKDRFASSTFWKETLEPTGKFIVEEVIHNDPVTQGFWAKENLSKKKKNNLTAILVAQIKAFQPNVIFVQDYDLIRGGPVPDWKREKSAERLCFGYNGIGIPDPRAFSGLDFVLTPLQGIVDLFNSAQVPTYVFRPGLPSAIPFEKDQDRDIGVAFVGSVGTSSEGHGPRLKFLAELSRHEPVRLYLTGLGRWEPWRWKQIRRRLSGRADLARDLGQLGKENRGALFGLGMYEALNRCRILLNFHVHSARGEAVNMRIYEGTGMGCCLLTDHAQGLESKFRLGTEVLTYRSLEEALEIIRNFREKSEVTRKIGLAGRERTLREHSLEKQIVNEGSLLEEQFLSRFR